MAGGKPGPHLCRGGAWGKVGKNREAKNCIARALAMQILMAASILPAPHMLEARQRHAGMGGRT